MGTLPIGWRDYQSSRHLQPLKVLVSEMQNKLKTPAVSSARFYTIHDIADLLEVSSRTVRRWIKQKLLIAHRMNGLVRISEADFRAFLSAHGTTESMSTVVRQRLAVSYGYRT